MMIQTITAYTYEIDDVEFAVSELLSQLKVEETLLEHSVGIVNCYVDFVETGVVEMLCQRLPFEIVGYTTMGSATMDANGQLLLTLTVLTSDTVRFSTAISSPLEGGNHEEALITAYQEAAASFGEKRPALVYSLSPFADHISGDEIVRAIDKASGGVPHFGTMAVGYAEDDLYQFWVVAGGNKLHSSSVLLLMEGDIAPTFYIASLSDDRILKQKAIITGSQGKILTEVNNKPVLPFLEKIGLSNGTDLLHSMTMPIVIDYNDGTVPVARAIYALTPEGYVFCGGDIPVDTTASVGTMDYEDVLETAKRILEKICSNSKKNGVLLFSCASRFLVLGTKFGDEMQAACDSLHGKLPFQMGYSGGEICPVYDRDGKLVNRFHNCTITACVF